MAVPDKKTVKVPNIKTAQPSTNAVAKQVALAIFGLGFALMFSYSLLNLAQSPSWGSFWNVLLFVMLIPITVTIDSILIRDRRMSLGFSVLLVLGLVAFFIGEANLLTLLILSLVNLFFLRVANHAGKKICENLIHFRWAYIAPHVLKPTFATLSLTVTVLYFSAFPIEDPNFNKPVFETSTKPFEYYLNIVSPGSKMTSTVQEFLLNAAAAEGVTPSSDAEKEVFVSEAVTKLNESINTELKLNFTLSPQQTLSDAFYEATVILVERAKPEIINAIIFILGLTVYFTLFMFAIPLAGISVWVGHLTFKILGALKLYSVKVEDRKKEVLVL